MVVIVVVAAVPVVIVVAWPGRQWPDGGSGNSGVTVAACVTYSVLSGLFPKLVAMAVSDGDGDSGGCGWCACSRMKQSAVKSSSFHPPILERELFS